MDSALVIGGTQFVGRHTVDELLAHGYDVTLFNRGEHGNPFADDSRVAHVRGDRTDEPAIRAAAAEVDPDLVVDCVAYHPEEVRVATDAFADAGAYVYVSSGSAYAGPEVPYREDDPLHPCDDEQADDDSMETYGPRKAEGDRAVFEAAEAGASAFSVRPFLVYGPHDYTGRFDYWISRVLNGGPVVVPGDGGSLLHRVYVEDVASAILTVAEEGEPGEAYNVADRRLMSLEDSLDRIADAAGVDLDVVHASERELASAGISPEEFPLYTPAPFVADTAKLAALGWESTPLDEAVSRTVGAFREERGERGDSDADLGPDRDAIEELLSGFGENAGGE